jgi:hypothetical protein
MGDVVRETDVSRLTVRSNRIYARLDPDYDAFAHFPRKRLEFIGRLLKYSCGIVTIKQLFTQRPPISRCNVRREV